MSFDGNLLKKILVSRNKSQDDNLILDLNKSKITLNKIGSFCDSDVYMIDCDITLSGNSVEFKFKTGDFKDFRGYKILAMDEILDNVPRCIFFNDDQNYNHVLDTYYKFMPKDKYIPKILILIEQINILSEIKNILKIKLICLIINYEELIPKNNEISFGVYPNGTGCGSAISLFISEK